MEDEPKNALWRREDQLRRWNISDTNKESAEPKILDKYAVKFQDGCVFLAACAAGDTDEVERLLTKGADINTANIDGLTALHQVNHGNQHQIINLRLFIFEMTYTFTMFTKYTYPFETQILGWGLLKKFY